MPIQIYNSLTKKKEDLIPLDGKTIKMYSCGVTVYDKCHIGHARSLCIFDMIRRYLAYRNYDVHFVRNITDVDDKIINKGKELGISFEDVVAENIELYENDLQNLGVQKADSEPRATQYIEKIIVFIKKLIDKGFAYESQGDVYYSVRKFKEYGRLSGQSIDQMIEATRIDQDPKKHDPLDFALWKRVKGQEKCWKSPWGDGRPGWHIECSCMSLHELDCETLDIHAGGRDLIFPHHENEIAQSQALTGKLFAKYWIHHGLLTINGHKMAKSTGNFITLDKILEKYPSDILKLFFLQSHYTSPVDFSWEKMEEVKRAYERISILLNKLDGCNTDSPDGEVAEGIVKRRQEFQNDMDDDFNTPKALSVIYDLVNECNKALDRKIQKGNSLGSEISGFIKEVFAIFGIDFDQGVSLSVEEQSFLDQRVEARKEKNFEKSDELRDLLKERGLLVEDTKDGQVWRRS